MCILHPRPSSEKKIKKKEGKMLPCLTAFLLHKRTTKNEEESPGAMQGQETEFKGKTGGWILYLGLHVHWDLLMFKCQESRRDASTLENCCWPQT